jgi:hypothetical protein
MRLLAALLVGLGCLALPAGASAQKPPAVQSELISYLGTVSDPQAISARFRDGLMYLSTLKGLTIYDVSNPTAPVERGRLPLPHFENEDVDLGGDILLISEDPNEGAGLLHVIDISDPELPVPRSVVSTGVAEQGQGILLGFAGLGDLNLSGNGHTASCVPPDCEYAILAGNLLGVDVWDLRDPDAPVHLKRVPVEEATGGLATHDVQFDLAADGTRLAWVSGAGGVAAYKVSDLVDAVNLDPEPYLRTDPAQSQSDYGSDAGTDIDPATGQPTGKKVNDFIHHNSMRLRNSSLAEPPAGAVADAYSDVLLVTEEDYNRPACDNAGSFQTWRVSENGMLRNLDEWRVEEEGDEQGTAGDDVMCSAHYFDERRGLVAQGWYQEGTRFFDVSDPANIRQVGYWIPSGALTWGAYFVPTDATGEIVYSLDFPRGIDVLRIKRPANSLPGISEPDPPAGGGETDLGGGFPDPGTADGGGGAPGPGTQENVTLPRPQGQVTVRVRGPKSLRKGRKATYRVLVRNGTSEARRVGVALRLSEQVRHLRGGRRRGRTVRWTIARLAPGATRTLRLTVRARSRVRRAAVPLAAQSAMPTVRAPAARGGGSRPVTFRSRFGAVCRVVVSVSG